MRFCRKDEEAIALIQENVSEGPKNGEIGNGRSRFDVIKPTRGGTSETYLLRRLKRDFPELHKRVVSGELTAHAAALEARICKPTWTAPVDAERLAERIAESKRLVEQEGMSLRQAADELGVSHMTVLRDQKVEQKTSIDESCSTPSRSQRTAARQVYLPTDVTVAAQKIRGAWRNLPTVLIAADVLQIALKVCILALSLWHLVPCQG